MTENYKNKFDDLKFKTDSKKDLEQDSPILSSDLSSEKIDDDSSNETLLEYQYSAYEQMDEYNESQME